MTKQNRLHVAIIPDGNRRWAKAHLLEAWKGHERALQNFSDLVEWAKKDGRTAVLTIWCFSTENWKRSEEEVSHLMRLLEEYIDREREDLLKNGIKLTRSGRSDRVPKTLLTKIDETGNVLKEEPAMILHLALDYGGKDEIVRAVQKIPAGTNVTEETIRAHTDHPELPDLDLIIRTSGERRTSNFFLWQSTYAEWEFSEKLFPEFKTEDLAAAIDAFEKRTRRFGA